MRTVGIGTRVLNCFIDTLILALISIRTYPLWNINVRFYHFPFLNYWMFFGIILFLYYSVFEFFFSKTPGKWLSYTNVVDAKGGGKPTFFQILMRSLFRLILIDMFFFPFLEKTLHDQMSGTLVVQDQERPQ